MIECIAKLFRSINSRLVGEKRFIIQKLLKASYGISVLFHHQGIGKKNHFVLIDNFDSTLNLKINTSWTMGFSIFWSGFHELRELLFLHKFLKPEMVLVDAGANMGEYSLFAAKRLTQGRVLAFEPLPKMLNLLNENIRLNNFSTIRVFPYGLSDREGVLPFHELDEQNGNEGLSTFYPGTKKVKDVIEAPLKSFDAEFESYEVDRIDFVKLDIEGGELSALRGMKKSLEKFNPLVLVEINEATYAAAGYQTRDIYDFFASISYRPYEISKTGNLKPAEHISGMRNIIFKSA